MVAELFKEEIHGQELIEAMSDNEDRLGTNNGPRNRENLRETESYSIRSCLGDLRPAILIDYHRIRIWPLLQGVKCWLR